MKRLFLLLMTVIIISASANAMGEREARREAQYLTDKMAYELGFSQREYERVYNINYRYLRSVDSRDALYASSWQIRNTALRAILGRNLWDRFVSATYFYRPVSWKRDRYVYRVYDRYPRAERVVVVDRRPTYRYSHEARYNERKWKHRNKGWKRHHDNGRHLGHYKYHGRW